MTSLNTGKDLPVSFYTYEYTPLFEKCPNTAAQGGQ